MKQPTFRDIQGAACIYKNQWKYRLLPFDLLQWGEAEEEAFDPYLAFEVDGYFVVAGDGQAFHDYSFSERGVTDEIADTGHCANGSGGDISVDGRRPVVAVDGR